MKNTRLSAMLGGGEDPPKKTGSVYTSQQQINKDNNFAKDFLARHGAPSYFVNNAVVARKVGDPVVQFVDQTGRPSNVLKPLLQTMLPNGVSINDVFQTKDGTYGYLHPQQGTFIQVDPQAIYSRYGLKK
jgi:hypothetical protein